MAMREDPPQPARELQRLANTASGCILSVLHAIAVILNDLKNISKFLNRLMV
ncbi:hypothetical protein [Falsochrobactrum shanghaiense]|uniref:hypothetical protein n=1 Tax=Falsochrobactrum shanghaiense TaxID=2201899 RepID=UPI001304D146|nr:hypothetical protein [Falsochrobactrum shanghaiense]